MVAFAAVHPNKSRRSCVRFRNNTNILEHGGIGRQFNQNSPYQLVWRTRHHYITNGLSLEAVEGLAFDCAGGRLYCSATGPKIIASVEVDGSNHRTLISMSKTDQPGAIALVPKIRKLYWTDWSDIPYIARADMYDGSDMEYIIESTGLQWPNGLAVDADTDEIFWCDGGLGRIEKASLSVQSFSC